MGQIVILENEKGQQIELSNKIKFTIDNITGLYPPNSNLYFNENISVGSQFQHAKTTTRNVVINMYILGDVETNRLELYNIVQTGEKIKIYISTYTKNVWIEGRVETCEVDNYAKITPCQISVICEEPWWKDLVETIHSLSSVQGNFYFPYYTVTPQPVSIYQKIRFLNLLNEGNASSGLTIELTANGKVVNPTIYNYTTKAFIGLGTKEKPYTMEYGDKIIITTSQNNKKIKLIRNAEETNIFNYLTPGSEFLQVGVGDNTFTYTTLEGETNLNISFKYYSQYKGI